jgi:hypothetical protein
VARGATLYGYFFYPLLTLGSEQLYRVHEAALRIKWLQTFPGRKKEASFGQMLDELAANTPLDTYQQQRWTTVRQLRNFSSHPERQSI